MRFSANGMPLLTYLVSVLAILSLTTAFPVRNQRSLDFYSYLTECEQKLQRQCVAVFGTTDYFPVTGVCKPEPLINCLELFMENSACKINDPGTIPYVKDFLHRLTRKYTVKDTCLSNLARKEVHDLFHVPDDFHKPAVDPHSFGSGTGSPKGKSMYYDDTESEAGADDGSAGDAIGSGYNSSLGK